MQGVLVSYDTRHFSSRKFHYMDCAIRETETVIEHTQGDFQI